MFNLIVVSLLEYLGIYAHSHTQHRLIVISANEINDLEGGKMSTRNSMNVEKALSCKVSKIILACELDPFYFTLGKK